jgi:hypothetical protein
MFSFFKSSKSNFQAILAAKRQQQALLNELVAPFAHK